MILTCLKISSWFLDKISQNLMLICTCVLTPDAIRCQKTKVNKTVKNKWNRTYFGCATHRYLMLLKCQYFCQTKWCEISIKFYQNAGKQIIIFCWFYQIRTMRKWLNKFCHVILEQPLCEKMPNMYMKLT